MGLVFAATHLGSSRQVTLALIRRELMATESLVERVMREVRAAADVQSEHAGNILDVGRLETGQTYVVTEYVEGQDVATYVDKLIQTLLGHPSASPSVSGPPVGLNRHRSRIPVFAGLAGVIVIGVGLWMFTRRYALEEQARIKAAADLAAAYSAAHGAQAPAVSSTARALEATAYVETQAPSGTQRASSGAIE